MEKSNLEKSNLAGATHFTTRHLRRKTVEQITGLSRSTIYDMMSKGLFPRPVKLTGKAVGWPETAIAEWLTSRAMTSPQFATRVSPVVSSEISPEISQ